MTRAGVRSILGILVVASLGCSRQPAPPPVAVNGAPVAPEDTDPDEIWPRGGGVRYPQTPLVNHNLPSRFCSAADGVIAFLRQAGENPKEFTCDLEEFPKRGELVFHLWHESAFREMAAAEQQGFVIMGNPGGKCRDVLYSLTEQRVILTGFWQ
jgi:hypothetical protein